MSGLESAPAAGGIARRQVNEPTSDELQVGRSKRASVFHGLFFCIRHPDPPASTASIHDADLIPEASAGFFSQLWFTWLTPLLSLGYARPLQASDLYKLPDESSSTRIANAILTSFERRRKAAAAYNERLANGRIGPGMKSVWWSIRGVRAEREKLWREKDGKRKASLILAMNDSVKWRFWTAGILKVIGDTAQVTSPLVVKAIITFASESYVGHIAGRSTPRIGKGIGLCFTLFALQLISSWCIQHSMYRSMSCGVLLRGGLITAIYSRVLSSSARSRVGMTSGKLVNHISTDVSRINFCSGYFHMSWTVPIRLTICLVLLLINLGPTALAGVALLVVSTPVNTLIMKRRSSIRVQSMAWTDKRSKLVQEMLSGMRVIKYFSWEVPFLKRISEYRNHETTYIRSLLTLRACLTAFVNSLPTLAAVITFIVYSLAGHSLTAANVFSSLALFQLIRLPLMVFPVSLNSILDAVTSCKRLYDIFEAETWDEDLVINSHSRAAVRIDGADFSWHSPPSRPEVRKAIGNKSGARNRAEGKSESTTLEVKQPLEEANVFRLKGIDMEIPHGKLVAIVGPIGSGKTSLLQGIIGEMRRTAGTIEFGGSVAYCAQTAWIQNATIRENICFGRPFERERYWEAVRDSCLESDLQMLPNYDLTEVGEKGISLSGGQKQRINICRAIYRNSDIMLFDDPLSALDAHVGKAVFSNVFKRSTAGKTRILVTHALHFLPEVDYIYTLAGGKIAERGTFDELMASNGAFCKFMEEFGLQRDDSSEITIVEQMVHVDDEGQRVGTKGKGMMQEEERNTGAVPFKVYLEFLSAGDGMVLVPILFLSLALAEGSNIMSSYWLVYWEERKWDYPQGFYMGIYVALGVSQSLSLFFMGAAFALLTYNASKALHQRAITRVLHAPMSFFETTPLGRIMSRFARDIYTIDNCVGDSLRMLAITVAGILSAIIFISIAVPEFLLVASFIVVCHVSTAFFYQASARELKRLDAILRSSLYAHFSESLTGLTTITAYGERDRFKRKIAELVDIENRAFWLTVANQRWLGVRLDLLGAALTFAVALLAVLTRVKISPGQTGVVLSYILMMQQSFGWMVRQFAEVENDMNAIERIIHYANEVEQEAPHRIRDSPAPPSWPSKGRIVMRDVFMKYRPELPHVLKGLNMDIAPGEKIGIVGRTGAGKSSIMTALYRFVELSSGSIQIDGVDISKIGLEQLRKGITIIPQDAFLFSGTLRSNLDPFDSYDDARLWDALKRAHLVHTDEKESISSRTNTHSDIEVVGSRFDLDAPVDAEGGNLSVGQQSLVSLARAVVRESKILILDEATASVDYETDRKIQNTIATEFKGRTILCIAHRLRTITSYDRICVLDAGAIVEFDTPANLFNIPDGIFRGMCDRSSISLEDILAASRHSCL